MADLNSRKLDFVAKSVLVSSYEEGSEVPLMSTKKNNKHLNHSLNNNNPSDESKSCELHTEAALPEVQVDESIFLQTNTHAYESLKKIREQRVDISKVREITQLAFAFID